MAIHFARHLELVSAWQVIVRRDCYETSAKVVDNKCISLLISLFPLHIYGGAEERAVPPNACWRGYMETMELYSPWSSGPHGALSSVLY
jgi:hypothetical protein